MFGWAAFAGALRAEDKPEDEEAAVDGGPVDANRAGIPDSQDMAFCFVSANLAWIGESGWAAVLSCRFRLLRHPHVISKKSKINRSRRIFLD